MSWALLIVEDDTDIRDELSHILEARGFHALAAANGVEALDVARQRGIKPSVILLDLLMPVMDGLEFLEKQHEVPLLADVPVVIITAQVARVPKQLPPTVRAVLEKPIPLAQLIDLVQKVCGSVTRSGVPRFAKGSGGLEAREIVPVPEPSPEPSPQAVAEPAEPSAAGAAVASPADVGEKLE